jgi:hypothetical protein
MSSDIPTFIPTFTREPPPAPPCTGTHGMTWPQYFDGQHWSNRLAVKYGVDALPSNILVGRDGRIIGKQLQGFALAKAVTDALAKK